MRSAGRGGKRMPIGRFFVRRAKTRRFSAGFLTKHIGQSVRCRWFEPNAPGRHRKADIADVFGAYGMPYEWGRLSDVFDAGSRLRRISAWLVVRWGGAAFGFRAARGRVYRRK